MMKLYNVEFLFKLLRLIDFVFLNAATSTIYSSNFRGIFAALIEFQTRSTILLSL